MRGISLWQPWASLMALEEKKDETRNGVTKVRGEVAICASLKWTTDLKNLACSEPFLSALSGFPEYDIRGREWRVANQIITATPLGCVVSVGELYDSIRAEKWIELHKEELEADASRALRELRFGNYAPGRGVWRFRNMRKLATPIPVRGGQQWFNLPPDVEAAVRAQL